MEPFFLVCSLLSPPACSFPLQCRNSREEHCCRCMDEADSQRKMVEACDALLGLPIYSLQRLPHSRPCPRAGAYHEMVSWSISIFLGKEDFSHVRPLTSSTSRFRYSKQVVTSLRFSLGMFLVHFLYYFRCLY